MTKNKKKKPARNKARDALGDYYLTNRAVEKENRQRQTKQKKWTRNEKVLLGIIMAGLVAIVIKYLVLG